MTGTSRNFLVQWLTAMCLIAMVNKAMGVAICNIDSTDMNRCLGAVTGNSPRPPTKECCKVVQHAKLPCLCSFKSVLPAFGINPKYALALPKKCGLETPPECRVS